MNSVRLSVSDFTRWAKSAKLDRLAFISTTSPCSSLTTSSRVSSSDSDAESDDVSESNSFNVGSISCTLNLRSPFSAGVVAALSFPLPLPFFATFGRVVLIDFDFCGEENVARYPIELNTALTWPPGVGPGTVMKKEHDISMLEDLCLG